MKRLILHSLLKNKVPLFFLFVMNLGFCVLLFFGDMVFAWNRRVAVQADESILKALQSIEQPYFSFYPLSSSTSGIRLVNKDGWVIENAWKLSGALKKELIAQCAKAVSEITISEEQASACVILSVFSFYVLFLNGLVLSLREPFEWIQDKRVKDKVSKTTALLFIVLTDAGIAFGMSGCALIRNRVDQGEGWLRCMYKYGLLSTRYSTLMLFLKEHWTDFLSSMLLVMLFCGIFVTLLGKLQNRFHNREFAAMFLLTTAVMFYLAKGLMMFQSRYDKLSAFVPGIGIIFMLQSICFQNATGWDILFCLLVNLMCCVLL